MHLELAIHPGVEPPEAMRAALLLGNGGPEMLERIHEAQEAFARKEHLGALVITT